MKRPFLPFISLTVCGGASNHWSPAAWPPSCSPLRLHTSALFRLAPLCSAQLQARHICICKFQKLHLLRQERGEPAQAILISAGDRRVAPMY